MALLLLALSAVQAAIHSFTEVQDFELWGYSGGLSGQAVVYNKYNILSAESSASNSTIVVRKSSFNETVKTYFGPASTASVSGLYTSPTVGLCWLNKGTFLFNTVNVDGALTNPKPFNITQGLVDSPALTQLSNGNFVVVWAQDQADGDSWGVYYRILDKNASPVTNSLLANVFTQGPQTNPTVIGCDGGFIIVWESKGANNGLITRKFSMLGQPMTEEHMIVKDYFAREPLLKAASIPTLTYLLRNNRTLTNDLMILPFDGAGNPRTTYIKGNWGQTSTSKFSYYSSPALVGSDGTMFVALQEERYDFAQSVRLMKLGPSGCELAEEYVSSPPHQGSWRVLEMVQSSEQVVTVIYADTERKEIHLKSYNTPTPSVCFGERNDFTFEPWTKPEASSSDDDSLSTSDIIIIVVCSVAGLILLLIAVKVVHWIYKKREKKRLKKLEDVHSRNLSAYDFSSSGYPSPHHNFEAELSSREPDILMPEHTFGDRTKF
mmetsp:Transcript_7683/g.14522  ORF Transcript_7683/g.14522 Transcript_7683/m.14522 type:complete len:492 (-) Transcript_7683:4430-5905(-)